MNIILCGSRDLEDRDFVRKSLVDFVAKVQYENVISLKDINFILVDDARGACHHLKMVCGEYGIEPESYAPQWTDFDEYPQKIMPGGYYGKYNQWAALNRNTKVVEKSRLSGGGYLFVLATTLKDTSDIVRKAKSTNNIVLEIIRYGKK